MRLFLSVLVNTLFFLFPLLLLFFTYCFLESSDAPSAVPESPVVERSQSETGSVRTTVTSTSGSFSLFFTFFLSFFVFVDLFF